MARITPGWEVLFMVLNPSPRQGGGGSQRQIDLWPSCEPGIQLGLQFLVQSVGQWRESAGSAIGHSTCPNL